APGGDATVAEILGVDRLDYTKGIHERLLAIERLLERHPGLRRRIAFTQVLVPSRERVAEYGELKREIDETVGRINGRFSERGWRSAAPGCRRCGTASAPTTCGSGSSGFSTRASGPGCGRATPSRQPPTPCSACWRRGWRGGPRSRCSSTTTGRSPRSCPARKTPNCPRRPARRSSRRPALRISTS